MHINDKLVENCGCRKCCINILPSLFINMAVPVSFFHLDNATVDLACWAAGLLLAGVEEVPDAKMKGFGLISR